MPQRSIRIPTADGICPATVHTPEGPGPWPGVLFCMDGGGIRPAITAMAQALADHGYLVLLPDLYYRFGPYGPLVPAEVFAGDARAILGPMMATTDNSRAAGDAAAFLAWFDDQAQFMGPQIGTVGFCMGGGMALTIAGRFPDRVAAAASFHGGRLATELPVSPHLVVGAIRGEVLIAGADADPIYPPDMAAKLEAALRAGGVTFDSSIWKGTRHGWMVPDFPVYDSAAAERGWTAMLALFARTLPGS
jgi:carboxymethylenebutenolidase